MKVRSRLTLATALVLMALLAVLYVGSRLILRDAFLMAEPEVVHSSVEAALGWLAVFLALVGLLFVLPLLWLQGHLVLNPLTRLTAEIQALPYRASGGRRLGWTRTDEFGVVARAVDNMLDAIDHEQRQSGESESRRRALLEANPDLLFLFDRSGTILDVKCPAGAEGALSINPCEWAGRNLREINLLPADVLARLNDGIRAAFETGQLQSMEFQLVHADGRDYWGEYRMVRIDANRVLVIDRNMTDRYKAERGQRLLEVRIGQKQKMESLGLLASGIAHDFNNILTAILGHAEEASSSLPPEAAAAAALASIRNAALRASGLTRQLQAYAGQGTFEFSTVNLNHLLRDMSQLLRSSLSKKATLELALDPELPVVEGDPSQLWQVAMNLLLNASEALDGKPGTLRLVTTRFVAGAGDLGAFLCAKPLSPGSYVLLELSDTGRGMPPEILARIFDPFFSTKSRGRGLGLSAVVGIVQAHGGGIAVRSAHNVGTTFRILLPQAAVQPAPTSVAESATVAPVANPALIADAAQAKMRVLLAEDDSDIRTVTNFALQAAGYEVITAENGRVAVDLYVQRSSEIHVVLLDQEMPVMNGEEAFRAIRAIRAEVPIVVMTGHGAAAAQEHFAYLCPAGVLGKPFTRMQLAEVLAKACQPLPVNGRTIG